LAITTPVPRWFPYPFMLIGAYIVLISMGLLPYVSASRKRGIFDSPEHWQITSIGLAFFCAGASLLMARAPRWLALLLGAITLPSFLAPMVWLIYFSGRLTWPEQVLFSAPLLLGSAGMLWGMVRTAQGKSSTIS